LQGKTTGNDDSCYVRLHGAVRELHFACIRCNEPTCQATFHPAHGSQLASKVYTSNNRTFCERHSEAVCCRCGTRTGLAGSAEAKMLMFGKTWHTWCFHDRNNPDPTAAARSRGVVFPESFVPPEASAQAGVAAADDGQHRLLLDGTVVPKKRSSLPPAEADNAAHGDTNGDTTTALLSLHNEIWSPDYIEDDDEERSEPEGGRGESLAFQADCSVISGATAAARSISTSSEAATSSSSPQRASRGLPLRARSFRHTAIFVPAAGASTTFPGSRASAGEIG
jgi:hypothetical protein